MGNTCERGQDISAIRDESTGHRVTTCYAVKDNLNSEKIKSESNV